MLKNCYLPSTCVELSLAPYRTMDLDIEPKTWNIKHLTSFFNEVSPSQVRIPWPVCISPFSLLSSSQIDSTLSVLEYVSTGGMLQSVICHLCSCHPSEVSPVYSHGWAKCCHTFSPAEITVPCSESLDQKQQTGCLLLVRLQNKFSFISGLKCRFLSFKTASCTSSTRNSALR